MARPTFRCALTCFATTLCAGFHLGWQLAVPNTATVILQDFINESFAQRHGTPLDTDQMRLVWGVYTGVIMLFGIVGGIVGSTFVNRIGRKTSLIICAVGALVSLVPAITAKYVVSYELLFVSRIGMGLVFGYGSIVQATYIIEICPQNVRGSMGCLVGVMLRGAFLIANVIGTNSLLGTSDLWPGLWIAEFIVSALFLVNATFCLETPSYLLNIGQEELAEKSILAYHGPGADVKLVMQEIKDALALQKSTLSVWQLLRTPVLNKAALITASTAFLASYTGVVASQSYSAILLEESGFSTTAASNLTILVGIAGMIGTISIIFLVEKFGRRQMLLFSSSGLTIMNLVIWLVLWLNESVQSVALAWLFLVAQLLLVLSFTMGVGPINFWLASELVPPNARGSNQSIATAMLYLGLFTAPVIFLPVSGAIAHHAFWLFIVPTALSLIVYWFLPETKNRTAEEIYRDLAGRQQTSNTHVEMKKINGGAVDNV